MIVYSLTNETLQVALNAAPKFANRNDWNLMSGPIGEWAAIKYLTDNGQRLHTPGGDRHDLEIYLPHSQIDVEVKTRSAGRTPPRSDSYVSAPARRVFRQSAESDLFIFAWRWIDGHQHLVALVGWEYARQVRRWPLKEKGTRWADADDVVKYDVLRQQISQLRPLDELIEKLDDETL